MHDWLTSMGGAEPVVLELSKLYPDAPIYTSVYDKERLSDLQAKMRTTYLQRILPKSIRYKHVLWPVLRAFAFAKLDLSQYDLIISSSSAEAKSVSKNLALFMFATATRLFATIGVITMNSNANSILEF